MKLLTKAVVFLDHAIGIAFNTAGILILFITFSVGLNVVMRYFFNRPLKGVDELCEYSLVYIAFLGAAMVLKKNKHVILDLLVSRLELRSAALLNTITSIVCLVICLILTWYGATVTLKYFQTGVLGSTTELGIPSAATFIIIPIGSFLLAIQFCRRTYGFAALRRAPLDESKVVKE